MLIVSEGRQGAVTMWVPGAMCTVVCLWPAAGCDVQTRRAWWPWYQPKRNAFTRNDFAVVDTYRRKLWPGRTLCWSAYPSMASGAPRSVIRQAEVPGRLFSSTGNGLAAAWEAAEVAGLGPAEPGCSVAVEVHAAAASVAAPAAARAAPRRARLIVTRPTEPHHRIRARFPRFRNSGFRAVNEARRPAFAEPHW